MPIIPPFCGVQKFVELYRPKDVSLVAPNCLNELIENIIMDLFDKIV